MYALMLFISHFFLSDSMWSSELNLLYHNQLPSSEINHQYDEKEYTRRLLEIRSRHRRPTLAAV